MNEKRKAKRWHPISYFKSDVVCNNIKEEVDVLDVSWAGMRVLFSKPVTEGMKVYGKLRIPYNRIPYFVRGRITRVKESGGEWETAVAFGKVSVLPFPDISL